MRLHIPSIYIPLVVTFVTLSATIVTLNASIVTLYSTLVTLNLFQGLCFMINGISLSQWMLNRVQHDEVLEAAE